MTHTVELSDDLISEARLIAERFDRTVDDQIAFWAHLGQAIEPLLRGDSAEALRPTGKTRLLSEALCEVSTEKGRERIQEYLQSGPFPRFEAVAGSPELLRKVDADGTVTVGKFVDRVFQTIE